MNSTERDDLIPAVGRMRPAPDGRPILAVAPSRDGAVVPGGNYRLVMAGDGIAAVDESGGEAGRVVGASGAVPGSASPAAAAELVSSPRADEAWFHAACRIDTGSGPVVAGYCSVIPGESAGGGRRGFEEAVCGGSNIKAPMRLDFIRALRETPASAWPEIYICRDEGLRSSGAPLCFESAALSADRMNCIGLVSGPGDGLVTLLRSGPVTAGVASLCTKDGAPCAPDSPEAWGFLARYSVENKSRSALDEALRRACRGGRGSFELLQEKVEYMAGQAVPENIILKTLESIPEYTDYPEMIPDPPVKFAQADAFGELTRVLAYRLCGMNLRLIGNKGCGKNTLTQTVDWLLGVPQYRMQGNAELDKLDLLGGPTIENGTMRYQLSDMLTYLRDGADVVLDEGNTIKPECADVLHSLTDEARRIEVPGYGLVKMAGISSFTITMNEDYAGTNFMNEATIDRFTPIQMSQPDSVVEILRRVVPAASDHSLRVCDVIYSGIRDKIKAADGLESEAMTIRGFVDALRAEPLLGLKLGLMDNVANKPQDSYTRLQLAELIESMIR